MKMRCEIIRDLFPSYIDGLTSRESNEVIEEHLEGCKACTEILEEMRHEIAPSDEVQKNKQDIQPFKKVKRNMRKIVAVTVLLCAIAGAVGFTGFNLYYNQTWEAAYEDVKLDVEAVGKVVTMKLTAKDENKSIVLDGNDGNSDTVVVKVQRNNPFRKRYQKSNYMGFTFIDENTVMTTEGIGKEIEEDDMLKLKFKDRTETWSMKELADKAMENPVADSKDVEMKIQKGNHGTVTLGFYPVLLGTSMKVEEKGEDRILIRMYYQSQGEPEDNGDFYSYTFQDESTLILPDGTERKLTGDEVLEIEYQDRTEKILLKDLAEKK